MLLNDDLNVKIVLKDKLSFLGRNDLYVRCLSGKGSVVHPFYQLSERSSIRNAVAEFRL